MDDLHKDDAFIQSVHNDLIDAYKRSVASNYSAGADVAEATISSVNDAEAAVLTAENLVTHAEAVMEDIR